MTTNGNKIYIHGMNGICSLGRELEEIRKNFFDPEFSPAVESYKSPAGKETVLFPIYQESFNQRKFGDMLSFNSKIATRAVIPLRERIRELSARFGQDRIGLVLGSSTSGIADFEDAVLAGREEKPAHWNQWIELGSLSQHLAQTLEVSGPTLSISTACSSGALIFIEGSRLLRNGLCDVVVVGSCDTLSQMTINGFQSLGAAATDLTNPFSVDRRGMNLGEGAAFFILTLERSEIGIVGCGESIDGYHVSSPEPEGTYAERAIRDALHSATLAPSDIAYINLHGTATLKNDEMEGALMSRVFGSQPILSSTKAITGHTLGSAGALELLLCCLILLNRDIAIPKHRMSGVSAFPELRFANGSERMQGRYCMSNSFAFGGSNASIIIGSEP